MDGQNHPASAFRLIRRRSPSEAKNARDFTPAARSSLRCVVAGVSDVLTDTLLLSRAAYGIPYGVSQVPSTKSAGAGTSRYRPAVRSSAVGAAGSPCSALETRGIRLHPAAGFPVPALPGPFARTRPCPRLYLPEEAHLRMPASCTAAHKGGAYSDRPSTLHSMTEKFPLCAQAPLSFPPTRPFLPKSVRSW